jgi:RNA polymerase sigma-70 factor, ECF subfamily
MSAMLATRDEMPGAYHALVEAFGFVPNLFRLQSLPEVIRAEQQLIQAILVGEHRLSRPEKEHLLCAVASARGNDYCSALFSRTSFTPSDGDAALSIFTLKLAKHGPCFCQSDVGALQGAGFEDLAILEAVATTALGQMLCTLAEGLRPEADETSASHGPIELPSLPESFVWAEAVGPYLGLQPALDRAFLPYVALREQFGFVPNLFRSLSLWPEIIEAGVQALERILFPEELLSRIQKENILLVVSAANLNTYCVTVHSQILAALGVPLEDSDQVVEDHRQASISAVDVALLDEVSKLTRSSARESKFEPEQLRAHGFTEPQIVEAVATAALGNFLNTLQFGLGAVLDFPPRRIFTPKDLYRLSDQPRLTSDAISPLDPDGDLVSRVQGGETDAFEELVRRHTRRIFGTLAGIVGNTDDARDATQDVFLKAFEHIGRFQGRSKFSTWLTSIAINTGTELLRQRKPSEPLDSGEDEEFRPRQIQSWADNPEQLLASSQLTDLVRQGVLRLPQKYRVAVLLRDINQLSTEEAAAALGLSIPALKARLLRGRLMLRESLAPHFIHTEKEP